MTLTTGKTGKGGRPASKWIRFEDLGLTPSGKTRRFEVYPISDKGSDDELATELGEVRWMAGWRRYAFWPSGSTVFESQCLRDIAAFCDWLMAERRAAR